MNARVPCLALAALSCGGDSPRPGADAGSGSFDRQALLATAANEVIVPTLAEFEAKTIALAAAVEARCQAPGEGAVAASRAAWRAAAAVWQRAELMRVGPANMDGGALRDRIDSWPVVSGCAVDQEVMARWQSPQAHDLSTKLTNRRGLPALEYLLFHDDLASTCATAPAGWTALSEDDRRAARCGYAVAAAADLRGGAQALHAAWTGGYATTFAQAGSSGSPFSNAHEAVNLLSDAFFVLDTDVKDRKLGRPAGIQMGSCPTPMAPCPQDVESPWSNHSRENVLANLRGFQTLFAGGQGVGFDDFLVASGAPELAAKLATDLAAAIAAVEAIPEPLAVAVVEDNQTVRAAHAAVKLVTDSLKGQFLVVLALDLPDDLGDDTD
jgi:predicted lipoprotein